MKKFFAILVCVISVVAVSAETILYTSTICGAQTYTVDASYFESDQDAKDYYDLLDKALCGIEDSNYDTEQP